MDYEASMHDVLERLLQDESAEPSVLPLSLLRAITNDFDDAQKFAEDGFSVVYKGVLRSGQITVKKLSESLHMVDRIFENEVGCLVRAKHNNIVRFLGYCADTQGRIEEYNGKLVMADVRHRLLCFEYPSGGKLDAYITDATRGLGWRKRYKIIKGICEGLYYLHQNHTVHLDLKPANIWLDEKKSPKIHVSGGSRRLEEKQSKVLTQDLVGTPYKRYMAPEIIDGVITLKTDIYSLGVLITEILTGQMELSVVENVLESWSDRLGMSLEDTRLQQVRVCAEICISCLHLNPEKRPDAGRIIEMLVQTESMDEFTKPDETENVDEFAPDEQTMEFNILERVVAGSKEPSHLDFSLLQSITENFSEQRIIGAGECGKVYKGILQNGIVAVKRLFKSRTIKDKMFHGEVQSLITVRHENIVRFLGYCSFTEERVLLFEGRTITVDIRERLLCFEYISNGTLENHLTDELRGLEWNARYAIILGICKGLLYLHKEKDIIHMDLKPENILMDDHMVPKITDFGSSIFVNNSQTNTTSRLIPRGYCAPEYIFEGKPSSKSDIYSLGVMITELVTGHRKEPNLTLVIRRWRHRWTKSLKHTILGYRQVTKCLELAQRCMQIDPTKRPDISDIIEELDEIDSKDDEFQNVSGPLGRVSKENVEPMHMPYKLLKETTDGFTDERMLRKGTFGLVYKGVNHDGQEIAVMLLNSTPVNYETFDKHYKTLAKLKHKNIVKLVGFCNETEELHVEPNEKGVSDLKMRMALCFEYMENKSLRKYLSDESQGFGWYEHYKIIIGVCEGLKYLQTGLEKPVYHLNLKPDNILLDENMVPKIADFGLSTMNFGEELAPLLGTSEYVPPEYKESKLISKDFDIFSLGVIILNIMSSPMLYSTIDVMAPTEIIEHVYNKWKERIQALPSYALLEADCQQVKRCVEIAVKCVEQDRHHRPGIEEIVQELNETETIAFVIRSLQTGKTDCTGRTDNLEGPKPMDMPYELLKRITEGFSDDHILGEGTFGVVYKGVDKAGIEIAVKILKSMKGVDDSEFRTEFNNLSKLKHQNIVQFVGFCNDTEEVPTVYGEKHITALRMHRALCFDYMHNGSLQKHLSDVHQGFGWQTRYKIIKGICEGLKYLHMGLKSPILHLDLKPGNILLDKNWVPKIADFGLSRLIGEEKTRMTIHLFGTLGYCPPEFIKYQKISLKFDIFSLGVIIIKIICGETGYSLACDMKSPAKFIKHVHSNWRERLRPARGSTQEIHCQQVKKCLDIALKCIEDEKERRPNIGYIVDQLTETEKCKNEFNDQESIPPESNNQLAWHYPGIATGGSKPSLLTTLPKNLTAGFLKDITNDFSPERKLSQGAFGSVYKGILGDGELIAVKLADNSLVAPEIQFQNEIRTLMEIQHENILKLLGYCNETEKKVIEHNGKYDIVDVALSLLCYEYAPKGSLANYIFDESSRPDWGTCFKIIKGICLGLHSLHKEMDRPIVHLNLQPANILLDNNMVPKISEFGLSRLFGEGQTQTNIIDVMGSVGYMAPEYLYRGEISAQADIYSLGVLIIEIATGEKVPQTWTDELLALKYSSLEAESLQQVKTCIKIGLRCLDIDRKKRPSIVEIVDKIVYKESMIHSISSKLLEVYPGKLQLPLNANKLSSCSLNLTNTTDDHVAVRLVAKRANRYKAKMPLCCIVPPKCIYTLIVTSSDQKKKQSLPNSDEFLTLESTICGIGDIALHNANPDSAANEFNSFFKEARETVADKVYELKLNVVSDPLEGTSSVKLQHSEIEILSNRKFSHVLSVDVHPMEPWILSTNDEGDVVIWNYQAQAIHKSFNFTEKSVYTAKFIEREQWLVAGDGYGTIYVYSYDTGKQVANIEAHDGDITSLAVHPTDPLVLSSSEDRLIKLWDWKKNWECTRTFEGHSDRATHVNFDPMDNNVFATASLDHTIKIWNISSPESKITLSDHPAGLLCIHSYTSDMRQYLIAGSWDGTAQIWNTETRRCIEILKGHTGCISCVYLHPDLPVVITGSHDGTIHLWNSNTYRLESIVGINLGVVNALGYIKDLRRIVVGCRQGIAIMGLNSG